MSGVLAITTAGWVGIGILVAFFLLFWLAVEADLAGYGPRPDVEWEDDDS